MLVPNNSVLPLTSYTITQQDVVGPFAQRTSTSLRQMAEVPGLSYKNPQEELAEKFHMNQELLRRLNPDAQFDRPGSKITVANVEPNEKRAILASWASDACAIEAAPDLRSSARGAPVRFDDIMEALRMLDRQANGHRYRRVLHRRGLLRRELTNPSNGSGELTH